VRASRKRSSSAREAASSPTTWASRRAGQNPRTAPIIANGTSGKTVLSDDGRLAIEVPRDREGTFAPRRVFFEAPRVKIRDEAAVRSKAASRARRAPRQPPQHPRDLGRESLDEGRRRSEGAWLPGHPHRRHDGLKGISEALRPEPRFCELAGAEARHPAGDLHDQRARKCLRAAGQDHQDPGAFSQRRCGDQTDVARAAKHHRRVGRCDRFWKLAMRQFAILYDDHFTAPVE
jgi:hypothetical protein